MLTFIPLRSNILKIYMYLPISIHEQGVTHGHFFMRSLTGFKSAFYFFKIDWHNEKSVQQCPERPGFNPRTRHTKD